jgi:predicted DNA-binding transcriptional regulator YafY
MKNSQRILLRQWELIRAIAAVRHGLTLAQLLEKTGLSRATVYRDLAFLREVGVPIATRQHDGEPRYRLLNQSELPELGLSAMQIAALHLARAELEPLSGTGLVEEFDQFLAKLRPIERQQSFRFAAPVSARPEILKVIDRSLQYRKRARLEYRAASRRGERSLVHAEPLMVSVINGDPYLRAFCIERAAERTYKIARISKIELTDQPFTHVSKAADADTFLHSVKAWSGDIRRIRVKLDRRVAWLAGEYPLPNQTVMEASDGSAIVEARVAGLTEARKWILSWGGAAEALYPSELRTGTQEELTRALAKYRKPIAKAAKRKSNTDAARSLTDRETGSA